MPNGWTPSSSVTVVNSRLPKIGKGPVTRKPGLSYSPMRRQRSLSMWRRCALAVMMLPVAGLVVVVGQMAVSQQASAPPPIQSQSVRYGGGGLLPSEQRYVKWRSGLLPSEHRDAQWGSMPSQGRISGAPNTVRYSSYNSYYNRTANSMAPATNRFTRSYNSPPRVPSIRYNHISSPGRSYRPYTQSHTYSFRQNYNSYKQVSRAKPSYNSYRSPSIRYGH
jgi:hypothetical protein